MRKEEIRTLSFLENDEESPKAKKQKKKKNKLQFKNAVYQKSGLSKEQNKETSLFSTQESKKQFLNYSTNKNKYNSSLQGIKESPEFPFMYNYNSFKFKEEYQKKNIFFQSKQKERNKKKKKQPVQNDKEYEIDIYSLQNKTTLMIRNIPNKYTKELMREAIDHNFQDNYDFFYLPIDFKNNCNVGYAFINFIDISMIKPFYQTFHNKKWDMFNSEKICEIRYARIQGKEACEQHFEGSSLMKKFDPKFKPFINNTLDNIHRIISNQKNSKNYK